MNGHAYTSGPWHISKQTFARDGVALEGDVTIMRMAGPCEAAVVSLGASPEEVAATARLIAAAPELLTALIDLQTQIRSHHKMNVKKDYSLMVADAQATAVLEKINAA